MTLNIILLSNIKNRYFGVSYGVTIAGESLGGFLARTVFLLNENHILIHRELVQDNASPPNDKIIFARINANWH